MELLYFSMTYNQNTFDDIVKKSKIKPSAAPQTFESMLIKGLASIKDLNIEMRSFPMISVFPGGPLLFWRNKREKIVDNVFTNWLPALNLQIFKQISFRISTYFVLKKWLKKNKDVKDKAVMIFSVYGPVAAPITHLCKKFNCQTTAIIPDLPQNMFATNKPKGLKALLANSLVKSGIKHQSRFDKYVFFTESINEVVNTENKPYIILEGICDDSVFNNIQNVIKSVPKAAMYAGMLNKAYNIDLIVNAFIQVRGDYELWLFGSGDYENEIVKAAEMDNRIKYFGRTDRKKVLEYEKAATILINVRNSNDDYTKYSFPSKNIEYMSSGTPFLTTKLKGIPKEYFDFVYVLEDETVNGLKQKLEQLLSKEAEENIAFGEKARSFVVENKNLDVQAEKIMILLKN